MAVGNLLFSSLRGKQLLNSWFAFASTSVS